MKRNESSIGMKNNLDDVLNPDKIDFYSTHNTKVGMRNEAK
jgi:hypothetical protein